MKNLRSYVLASVSAIGLGMTAMSGTAQADALSTPAMAGPLAANPSPFSVNLPDWFGDAGGKVYIGGAVTGLAFAQTDPGAQGVHDVSALGDLSNGQLFIQKTDGWLQFYVQAGIYSLPTLGSAYQTATAQTHNSFGYAPVAYLKLAGEGDLSAFSIEAGKLPTLIGAEDTFTFENMNIERGLLWNLEPAISRGAQVNYSKGPLTISLSWNDGSYSNVFNWLSGLVSYGFNGGADTLEFAGGGSLGSSFHTSVLNSGSVYNLIYTHTSGPWTITPYIQYVTVPTLGFASKTASVWGGALLASYSINDNWKLAGRFEYEGSSGNPSSTFNTLGFGAGSGAWSVTVTPSYQWKAFFTRVDLSYVGVSDISSAGFPAGGGFGSGADKGQFRGVLEGGILF